MELLLGLTIIGFVATSAMISFMWMITGTGNENVDMVKAIGAIYTHSLANAFAPGLLVQYTSGVLSPISTEFSLVLIPTKERMCLLVLV
jgi:type II secretory pathway pseudopilin PulG